MLIVAATLAAYWSSFDGAMVFDDDAAIVNNPTIRHLWPPGAVLSPPLNGSPVQGRPLVNITLAVNYALGGTNVWGYHAVNLLVHVLAALTLFGIVRRTLLLEALRPGAAACRGATVRLAPLGRLRLKVPLGRTVPGAEVAGGVFRKPRSREDWGGDVVCPDDGQTTAPTAPAALALATAVALLWALHPLQTESVTFISQRAESMMGLLLLLTLYCSLRSATAHRPRPWTAAAVGACLLGMAAKEMMVLAPLLVLLYDRTFLAGSFGQALRRRRGLYAGLAATWGLLVCLLASVNGRPGTGGFVADVTPFQYACTQFGAVMGYLGQSFWPGNLVFEYGTPAAQSAAEIAPYAVAVGLLLAATAVAVARGKPWGFLGAWFFVILAPSSTFIRLSQAKAEHRMYLPLAAVVVLVVIGAYRLSSLVLRRIAKSEPSQRRWGWGLSAAATAAAAAVLGCLTFQRNTVYRSAFSIWDDTVRKCPGNARAWEARGIELGVKGRPLDAIADFNRAIKLRPNFAKTYDNRGAMYQSLGRFDLAIRDFDKAIELEPGFATAYVNRGAAYGGLGQYPLAIRDLDKAIELRGDYGEAYRNRALAHCLVRDYDRAWADVRAARGFGAPPDPAMVRHLEIASGRSR